MQAPHLDCHSRSPKPKTPTTTSRRSPSIKHVQTTRLRHPCAPTGEKAKLNCISQPHLYLQSPSYLAHAFDRTDIRRKTWHARYHMGPPGSQETLSASHHFACELIRVTKKVCFLCPKCCLHKMRVEFRSTVLLLRQLPAIALHDSSSSCTGPKSSLFASLNTRKMSCKIAPCVS